MVFVNSMSDMFHRDIPDDFIADAARVMQIANWHTYQVLTKRAERLRRFLSLEDPSIVQARHVWFGVSVEDRRHGLPRIDQLRETPAAVRFLSVEPLLEDLGELDLSGIHWVIVGGESGPGARPMQLQWVVSVREQCRAAGVPFFFKQWGGVQKSKNGRHLDGRTWDDLPPICRLPVPPLAERERRLRLIQGEIAEYA